MDAAQRHVENEEQDREAHEPFPPVARWKVSRPAIVEEGILERVHDGCDAGGIRELPPPASARRRAARRFE